MNDWNNLVKIFIDFNIASLSRAISLVFIGFFLSKLISASVNQIWGKHLRPHQAMLLRRILFYVIFIIFFISAIQELGFHISALLGATGILTVALGIAAQTSMANMVSGIFIIGEKPFEIGDAIKVNDAQGEVVSIDFLSVKIRTSHNTMIRIPNEMLIKSTITNLSYFPTRRVEIILNIAYQEDLTHLRKIFLQLMKENSLCLSDPRPEVEIEEFDQSTIQLHLYCWGKKNDYNSLRSSLHTAIKNALTEHSVNMHCPQQILLMDSPLPIAITSPTK